MYKNKIKELRTKNNITQNNISNLLKISRGSYCHYELEDDIIPLKYLNIICNYFKVSIDYILEFTNEQKYSKIKPEIDFLICGKNLKAFRKERKITQKELAKILNTTQSTIADYENGKHLISTSYLYAICIYFNISADYLLGKINIPLKINPNKN